MPRRARSTPSPLRRRRILAAVTAAVVAAGGAVAVPTQPAAAAGATLSGQVFRDYNGNGVFDRTATGGGPREMGLEQVTVRAYDARGALVGETATALGATTDTGGAWSTRGSYTLTLDASVATGDPLRLEFDADGYHDTFSGTAGAASLYSNASVRFLTAPAAGATGVDFGVSTAEDYSTTAPPLVSIIQSAGDPLSTRNATAAGEPAIVSQYWKSFYAVDAGQNDSGHGTGRANAAGVSTPGGARYPKRHTLATFGEVGSVWGTAFQTSKKNVYAGAVYKRLAGLGSLGVGGIYRIPVTFSTEDGQRTATRTAAPEAWLDVQGAPVANVPGAVVDLGPAQTNAQRGLGAASDLTADPHAFAHSGKIGLGAITVSADDRWLYFVNLYDRELYRVDIADPSRTAAAPHIEHIALALPAGTRPWAVSEHHGRVYVGFVDEGTAWQTGQALTATVMSATIAEVDAAAGGAPLTWTEEVRVDLGYKKGPSYFISGANATSPTGAPWLYRWNAWVDTWTNPSPGPKGINQSQPAGVGYYEGDHRGWGDLHTYPQAVLSDIEFSDTNDLVLGIMDRTSLQAGNRNVSADGSGGNGGNGRNNKGYEAVSSGDLLIAAKDADGRYVLEHNGVLVDGRTSRLGTAGEGVGGKEFFSDSNKINGGTAQYHRESALGGIAAKTGYNGVIAAVIDPLNAVRVTGLKWFSTDDGAALGGYQHTEYKPDTPPSTSFQKGGGLGNVQTLAEEAPLQIGDRVWFDANRNGIQDPAEPPLAGIVVTATRADGTGTPLVATTDANGAYLFSSTDAEPLEFSTDYIIGFSLPTGADPTAPVFPGDPRYGAITWGDLRLTFPHAGDGTRGEVDSNPDPATGTFPYTTGAGGQNDHSLDAGYFADLTPTATIEKFDGAVDASGNVTREGEDADTFAVGAVYTPGEQRTVVVRLTNTGPEPLKNVVLTDVGVSGAAITSLRWWLPGERAPRAATWDDATQTWSYTWAETVDLDGAGRQTGYPQQTWAVGDVVVGEATLTVTADAEPHRNEAAFRADGAISGNPVSGDDPYTAFTGGIQVIKHDGNAGASAPAHTDPGGWVIPDKNAYGVDAPEADADTAADAVVYTPDEANTVQYVVTNTGTTWLTSVQLDDDTLAGPRVRGWTADLSGLRGPDGTVAGHPASVAVDDPLEILFGPGQSFVVTGSLALGVQETHHDEVTATATVVVPAVDADEAPTGAPATDPQGDPVRAPDPDDPTRPFEVRDEDPFHARAPGFHVQKAGAGGVALDGSSFRLRDDDTSGAAPKPGAVNATPVTAVAGETGRFLVAGLPAGAYWLEETRAPDGHELLPQPVRIVVAADGTVTVPGGSALVSAATDAGVSTVTVVDAESRALPLTGSTGPLPYLLVGGVLALAGLGLGLHRLLRRRS